MQDGFEEFLRGQKQTGGGILSRLSRANRAEGIVGNLDAVASDDEKMYKALLLLKEEEQKTGDHNNLQNAVRKYYQYRNGHEFPKLKDYERMTGR